VAVCDVVRLSASLAPVLVQLIHKPESISTTALAMSPEIIRPPANAQAEVSRLARSSVMNGMSRGATVWI
jgi:hypothetical protein